MSSNGELLLISNNGLRYRIPKSIISHDSLLRVISGTEVGLDMDEEYIILDNIPKDAFRAYVSYLNFNVDFEFNKNIAVWFDYLGHHNIYEYPLDYWKIKLIDEHDMEFKYVGGIERITYLTGMKVENFLAKYGIYEEGDLNRIDNLGYYIYYNANQILFRYITVYEIHNKIMWLDPTKINNMDYIGYLCDMSQFHNMTIKFPLLDIGVDDHGIVRKIEEIYEKIQYNYTMDSNINAELEGFGDKIINIGQYNLEQLTIERLRNIDVILPSELVADYLDRNKGTTLEKLESYNAGGYLEIKASLLIRNFDDEYKFELLKEMIRYGNIKDRMMFIRSMDRNNISMEELYRLVPHDPMSIILLVTIYGFNIYKLLQDLNINVHYETLEEFYYSSPLIN